MWMVGERWREEGGGGCGAGWCGTADGPAGDGPAGVGPRSGVVFGVSGHWTAQLQRCAVARCRGWQVPSTGAGGGPCRSSGLLSGCPRCPRRLYSKGLDDDEGLPSHDPWEESVRGRWMVPASSWRQKSGSNGRRIPGTRTVAQQQLRRTSRITRWNHEMRSIGRCERAGKHPRGGMDIQKRFLFRLRL